MISILTTNNRYILQPNLLDMHRQSLDWLSATILWKREIGFFQKLIDQKASEFTSLEDKKKLDHFQNIITYYNGELVDTLRSKLREHESLLAHTLQKNNETNTTYFEEHNSLMDELSSLDKQLHEFKYEFFTFIEKVL